MIAGIKSFVESNDTRPSWDEYYMSVAFLMSSRSPIRAKKVGAVIVQNNRIISSGYNGFPAGLDYGSILVRDRELNTIHAEQNAIFNAARQGVSIEGATMYSTHEPCINCAKSIIASGITSVKYYYKYEVDITNEPRHRMFLGSNVKLSSFNTLPDIPNCACADCDHAKGCSSAPKCAKT
jgi:dCMP deaminase